jgi:transcriptional regulator with XRE-family HTH domain
MDRDEQVEPREQVDLEETVAKSVRRLREARRLSQQQLGADLLLHGLGMSQEAVAKVEAGARRLRLNELAAIADYFEVSVETLWQDGGETLNARAAALESAKAKHLGADYYTQQRVERLRDKQAN